VDPSGKFAYVANSDSSNVSAYTIDSTTGALTPVPGAPFAAGLNAFSVAVDPSGKFAYVANQCGNCPQGSVSAYTIDSTTGALTPVPGAPFAAGTFPVSVAVDPSDKFAYVANECSSSSDCSQGNVSAYTIDSTTGALSPVPGAPFAAGIAPRSVAIAGQSTVPFAAFTAEADITLGLPGEFEVEGEFTLGDGSNGINPLTEDVNLQVGTFSTTIPAGSFFKQRGKGPFEFAGIINGVELKVVIHQVRHNHFHFTAHGEGANLTGTANPVTVGLTIGDDVGSTMVTAEFD
jgi:hypothetical protein